jgi:hypothetical protein
MADEELNADSPEMEWMAEPVEHPVYGAQMVWLRKDGRQLIELEAEVTGSRERMETRVGQLETVLGREVVMVEEYQGMEREFPVTMIAVRLVKLAVVPF